MPVKQQSQRSNETMKRDTTTRYFMIDPTPIVGMALGMAEQEELDFYRQFFKALCTNTRNLNTYADDVLERTEKYRQEKSEKRQKAASVRWEQEKAKKGTENANAVQSPCKTMLYKEREVKGR